MGVLCLRACFGGTAEKDVRVCVFDCVTSFRRWGSGIGLTWKLCLVFMAFRALRCYLKDRAQKAASVADCRPGMSQPPDY